MSDIKKARQIFETCLKACNSTPEDYELFELKELITSIINNTNQDSDFYLELAGGKVRLIDSEAIDEIWTKSLIEEIKECYDLPGLPEFVAIDWEKTANNCKADGVGHHFATYDGQEYYCNGWYIFRTN